MRTLVAGALHRHALGAVACALVAALAAAVGALALPERWRVGADVYVSEPATVHRLTNPFAAVPSEADALPELQALLTSHAHLVSLVKRTGLVDQWQASRPPVLRLKDAVLARVRGEPTERDVLDALVKMLETRLQVRAEKNHVRITVVWPSPEVAFGLVEGTVTSLREQRVTREGRALEEATRALEEQLTGVRTEMTSRLQRLDEAWRRGAWSTWEVEEQQLRYDQARAAELLVRAEEKALAGVVLRKANDLRFRVVHPPQRPLRPEDPPWALRLLVILLTVALAGVAGAVVLDLASGRVVSGAHLTAELGLPVLARLRVGPGGAPLLAPTRVAWLLALGLAGVVGAAGAVSRGNPALALAPLAVAGGVWFLLTRPLKWPLLGLMLVAVTADDPTDRAYFRLWQSPLWELGRVFFTNVAWFTGFELALMGLFALMAWRTLWRRGALARRLDPVHGLAPRPLRWALLLSGATVGWLIAWGLAQGGGLREALWQFRMLLTLPLVGVLALYAFDLPDDLPRLFGVLVVGSLTKAALGTYFMYAVAFPQAEYPPHTTGHNDTMLFVTAVVVAVLFLWERPIWKYAWLFLGWMPFVAMALRLNDRRIAYVDIAIALAFVFVVSPMHRAKRALTRLLVASLPALLVYAAAGWNTQGGGVFSPVQKVRSIVSPAEATEEESSNVERDIENYNLLKSWERVMVLGQGFGHAFTEYLPSNDFSQSNFGLVGHNSILWLWWIGGLTGFTGVMLYLAVAFFFVGRTLPRLTAPTERVALLAAMSILLTYLMQAFGDMGTQSVALDFFVAAALAIIGRLATRVGAWQVPARPPAPEAPRGLRLSGA